MYLYIYYRLEATPFSTQMDQVKFPKTGVDDHRLPENLKNGIASTLLGQTCFGGFVSGTYFLEGNLWCKAPPSKKTASYACLLMRFAFLRTSRINTCLARYLRYHHQSTTSYVSPHLPLLYDFSHLFTSYKTPMLIVSRHRLRNSKPRSLLARHLIPLNQQTKKGSVVKTIRNHPPVITIDRYKPFPNG